MGCCPASDIVDQKTRSTGTQGLDQWVQHDSDDRDALELLVPGIHCGGCINKIESVLNEIDGVDKARVNLSTKRLSLKWQPDLVTAPALVKVLEGLGYEARPFDMATASELEDDTAGKAILRSLAVAGFAAANVMLLSISVWAGAEGTTRQMFHWLSALIAIPAIGYAGRPFFHSAAKALSHRRLNMDVPISLAVLLAGLMSFYETVTGGAETYFDAALTLLFFLLAGRYLDHMMREKARSAVSSLLSLNATGATIINEDGERQFLPVAEIRPGMTVLVVAGERVPVDGVVIGGTSDIDRSIVTGESLPEKSSQGTKLEAGVMNLTSPLQIRVTAIGHKTFLGEVISLMETAEQGKAGYMRVADRAAQIYAPVVHLMAAATFIGWLWWSGGDWHHSLFTAIAVLIITCPCALGLAVPAVQIVASGILFRRGILVKDGSALERMSSIDTVVFDKTGTLTTGKPVLSNNFSASDEQKSLVLAMARESAHPLSIALQHDLSTRGVTAIDIKSVVEVPGHGIEAQWQGKKLRLGEPQWCDPNFRGQPEDARSHVAFSVNGKRQCLFSFHDQLRPDARQVVQGLLDQDRQVILLSGDNLNAVKTVAASLGIEQFYASKTPQEKAAFIQKLQAQGKKTLMVGDGINDAPSLASATASMAPSSASDIGKTAADMVFTSPSLQAVADGLDISEKATRHVNQNFALAVIYNLIAIPLAVTGFATPLIAAIAMSSSSIIVTANALRLRLSNSTAEDRVSANKNLQLTPQTGKSK